MSETLIAPDGSEWPDVAALPATIAAWETAKDRTLPAAYRAFLAIYNGGRIYPLVFDVRQPPEAWGMSSDYATFVDVLYDWDYATTLWDQKTYGNSTPPDMFFIGCNPGGLEILLSIRPATHGQIFTWWACNPRWGDEGNTDANLHLQAQNFVEFIAQMYETPDGIGMDYWDSPDHKRLAKPLKVG